MPRPAGRRNTDFESKRAALVRRAGVALLSHGAGASFRDLADAIGVSVTNLKHYFADRDTLFAAIAEDFHREGQQFMDDAAIPRSTDPTEAIRRYLENVVAGWRFFGVERVHAVCLAEGLGDPSRGQAYVTHVLEPTLASCEKFLGSLVEQKALPRMDLRIAALSLAGPVLLALLHQDSLRGVACRPLDVQSYVQQHIESWLHGHGITRRGRAT